MGDAEVLMQRLRDQELTHATELGSSRREREAFRQALAAERAYARENSGEHARQRKAAMAALPKGWNRSLNDWVLDENQQWRLLSEVER